MLSNMSIHSLSIHIFSCESKTSGMEFLVNQMYTSITRIIFPICFIVEYYFHYPSLNIKLCESYDNIALFVIAEIFHNFRNI
jgi:hypothetical protein